MSRLKLTQKVIAPGRWPVLLGINESSEPKATDGPLPLLRSSGSEAKTYSGFRVCVQSHNGGHREGPLSRGVGKQRIQLARPQSMPGNEEAG